MDGNATRDIGTDARAWDRFALAFIVAGAVFRVGWGVFVHPALNYVYSDMGG